MKTKRNTEELSNEDFCSIINSFCENNFNESSIRQRWILKFVKYWIIFYTIFLIGMSIINFFFGMGIDGPDPAFKYASLSLALSLYTITSIVPGLGLVTMIIYDNVTNDLVYLLEISHNFWIDAFVINLVHVIGVITQSLVLLFLIYHVFKIKKKNKEK